jgi:membrane associated rhomboid family serine protease
MDLALSLSLAGGAGGVGVAICGAAILVTGRATGGDQRAFRRPTDAGLYYLYFGLATALLALSSLWIWTDRPLIAAVTSIIAMVMGALAFIRYRPRRNSRQ